MGEKKNFGLMLVCGLIGAGVYALVQKVIEDHDVSQMLDEMCDEIEGELEDFFEDGVEDLFEACEECCRKCSKGKAEGESESESEKKSDDVSENGMKVDPGKTESDGNDADAEKAKDDAEVPKRKKKSVADVLNECSKASV